MTGALAESFRKWSDIEAVANASPLYEVLGHVVAGDHELLALASEAKHGQPAPNMLFAAVHLLLAGDRQSDLAGYYRTLGGTRLPDERVGGLFRQYCRANSERIAPILRANMVQTNEVRRSAVLMPALAAVAEDGGGPLALYEIGPSAGLNLNFDRYAYDYGGHRVGSDSPVVLESDPRGDPPRVLIPAVASRMGVDLNPLHPDDPAAMAWLRALIWPEHTDRLALLDAATGIARENPPELVAGDFREVLPERVLGAPTGSVPTIFATFVLNQFPKPLLDDLRAMLLELSRRRPVYFVVMGFTEFIEPGRQFLGDTAVWILRVRDGAGEYRHHATANPHGRWLELANDSPWLPWGRNAKAGDP